MFLQNLLRLGFQGVQYRDGEYVPLTSILLAALQLEAELGVELATYAPQNSLYKLSTEEPVALSVLSLVRRLDEAAVGFDDSLLLVLAQNGATANLLRDVDPTFLKDA